MTTALAPEIPEASTAVAPSAPPPETLWRQVVRSRRVLVGGGILLGMTLLCLVTLPWTLSARSVDGKPTGIPRFQEVNKDEVRHPPRLWPVSAWFGFDNLGRSVLVRSLVGGTISLAVGAAAATIAVILGVAVGLFAGYRGGWVDSVLMRFVDIMYGLPYILLVILFKIAFEQPLTRGIPWPAIAWFLLLIAGVITAFSAPSLARENGRLFVRAGGALAVLIACAGLRFWHGNSSFALKFNPESANLVVLFSAIGLVSWLTMSRVVRGQVLSLRGQPFVEACRAMGLKERRIFLRHILPNLVGPITVYATLTVPSAILQESFLSFLGVGVNPPLATWGSLASEGVEQLSPLKFYWWLLLFPCTLLAVTLLSLNFLGDGLRDVFDPKKEAAKI